MKLLTLSLFAVLLCSSGCSNQQIYTGIQKNRQQMCERLEGTAREECLKQYDTEYNDYQKERERLIQAPEPGSAEPVR